MSMYLSYVPIPGSQHVYLNGIEMQQDVDWEEFFGHVSFLDGMGQETDDVIEVLYAHRGVATVIP